MCPPRFRFLQNADGRVPWCADGYYLAVRPQFTFDSDFHAGAYYVQEASSQFVGRLMGGEGLRGSESSTFAPPRAARRRSMPRSRGPTGWSSPMRSTAAVRRYWRTTSASGGTGNVAVTTCEPRQLGDFEAWFDMVAVDAPCSGEGMFRKDAQARAEWNEGNVKLCAARQDGYYVKHGVRSNPVAG